MNKKLHEKYIRLLQILKFYFNIVIENHELPSNKIRFVDAANL